jgi:hypothetical protein
MEDNVNEKRSSIDFGQIVFPSDSLTLGSIRAAQGSSSRHSFAEHNQSIETPTRRGIEGLYDMFVQERQFARTAFEKGLACREPSSFNEGDRWTEKDWQTAAYKLNEQYERYGLSGGDNETKRLIRKIEGEAVAQTGYVAGRHR